MNSISSFLLEYWYNFETILSIFRIEQISNYVNVIRNQTAA